MADIMGEQLKGRPNQLRPAGAGNFAVDVRHLPGQADPSVGKYKPPTVPGAGNRSPSSEPGKGHKGRNTVIGLTTVAALGGVGCVAAEQLGKTQPGNDGNPATTVIVDEPVTTLGEPATTVITVPNTETPSTIAERVFASPEQKIQVEAVEANMAEFFALTPEALAKYKETTRFDPDPDGFSTTYLSNTSSVAGVLGIDLGTFQIPVGDGVAFIVATGHMTENGSQYVLLQHGEITDSTLQAVWFNYENGASSNFVKGTVVDGVTTYPAGATAETLRRSNGRTAMIADLNASIGEPVYALYGTDPAEFSSPDYPVEPSPIVVDVLTRITRASDFSLLGKVLSEYSTDTLESVGVYKEMSLISQNTLAGYKTATELLSNMALSDGFRLFDGVPTVI